MFMLTKKIRLDINVMIGVSKMNKYEKAFMQYQIDSSEYKVLTSHKYGSTTKEDESLLQELVERATPKKLKKYNKEFYECECGTIYKFKDSNFCGYCGNKFDWSE